MFEFIIPVCNIGGDDFFDRVPNIQRQIDNYPSKVKIIIVEQIVNNKFIPYGKKLKMKENVRYIFTRNKVFNKSWLINIGINASTGKNLIIGESDCTPGSPTEEYFDGLYNYVIENNIKWCHGWNRILYYNKNYSEIIRDDGPRPGFAEGGLVYFNKTYLLHIGGYNELLRELGGIDNEICRRAEIIYDDKPFKWTIIHHYHRSNKMKGDWKNAKYRETNKKIYQVTKRNPDKSIDKMKDYLKKHSINKPIVDYVNDDEIVNFLNLNI